MSNSVRRRVRRSRREQRALVERFESSGLSAKQFCRREGVALSSLQRWRQRTASTRRAGFVELLPTAPAAVRSPGWLVELVLPNGACLRVRE